MGKKLIIKGADFSADAIPQPTIVWNDVFVDPTISGKPYFVVGSVENNFIGPYYSQGAIIDGIKLSLLPYSSLPAGRRNLQVGDTLRFAKISTSSPFNKTTLAEVTLTQEDFNNQFIIVRFNRQQLSSSEFLGIGLAESTSVETSVVSIPYTFNQTEGTGILSYWIKADGTAIYDTYSSGAATFYLED